MSRSFYKTRIHKNVNVDSEKFDKRLWHSKLRRKSNVLCQKKDSDVDATAFPVKNEVSNPYMFGKEGKSYCDKDVLETISDTKRGDVNKDLRFNK